MNWYPLTETSWIKRILDFELATDLNIYDKSLKILVKWLYHCTTPVNDWLFIVSCTSIRGRYGRKWRTVDILGMRKCHILVLKELKASQSSCWRRIIFYKSTILSQEGCVVSLIVLWLLPEKELERTTFLGSVIFV